MTPTPGYPYPSPLPPRKSKPNLWVIISVVVVLGFLGLFFLLFVGAIASASRPAVGLIELSGAISDEGARGLLGGGPAGGARGFIDDVEEARRDSSIKAVVIRINSPGGSASASQEMYQAVRRLQAVKPVICSMGDVAASGGYYVASACDKIYANGATLTGSIGVISEFLNYGSLFKKFGLDQATIKSGKFKDAGSPTRPLTPEERQLFQNMINDCYGQFVTDVVAGRKTPTNGKLTRQKLLKIADGRVFTGRQAKAVGLVDENGGLYDAVQEAAQRGNLSGTPIVRDVNSGGGLASMLGASAKAGLGLDSTVHDLGASFAQGGLDQLKEQGQTVSAPMAR